MKFLQRSICALITIGALAAPSFAQDADAADAPPSWMRFLDNEVYKISLDLRARVELADRDGLRSSDAWTVRTRLGIGTKPIHGFSAFAEVENIFTFDDGGYFDIVSPPNSRGLTPIADPTSTELNRLWVQYANPELAALKLKVGRQRIKLDDDRFVGNVGWRQNEQTYDAALFQSSLGVEGLTATYAYIDDVRRIFGDEGPAGTRDFDSNSHIVNIKYGGIENLTLTGFAYLLDFDNSPINSSDTYGFRGVGSAPISDSLKFLYSFSYAYQTDAANNPLNYDAHYVWAEAGLGTSLGTVKAGYELLGSDDGTARFVTPLATAHKFNGFADVFLNNGGPNGLQDAWISVSPKLPLGLKGFVTYHHFWSDEGSDSLGDEIDFVLKRNFGKHVEVLSKGGFFFGDDIPDLWRWWLQVTFKF